MSKDTGGSAFPLVTETYNDETREVISANRIQNGITKRDYFAAKAVQSIMTNEAELQRIRNHYVESDHLPAIAAMAYRLADAMIEARNK